MFFKWSVYGISRHRLVSELDVPFQSLTKSHRIHSRNEWFGNYKDINKWCVVWHFMWRVVIPPSTSVRLCIRNHQLSYVVRSNLFNWKQFVAFFIHDVIVNSELNNWCFVWHHVWLRVEGNPMFFRRGPCMDSQWMVGFWSLTFFFTNHYEFISLRRAIATQELQQSAPLALSCVRQRYTCLNALPSLSLLTPVNLLVVNLRKASTNLSRRFWISSPAIHKASYQIILNIDWRCIIWHLQQRL